MNTYRKKIAVNIEEVVNLFLQKKKLAKTNT